MIVVGTAVAHLCGVVASGRTQPMTSMVNPPGAWK